MPRSSPPMKLKEIALRVPPFPHIRKINAMEVTLPKRTTSRIVSPASLEDSDKNYEIMESFNQVYSIIKVKLSKREEHFSCVQDKIEIHTFT